MDRILTETGIEPVTAVTPGVEAVRRSSDTASYLFLINHGTTEGIAAGSGVDLLTGFRHDGKVTLPPGAVAVVRED